MSWCRRIIALVHCVAARDVARVGEDAAKAAYGDAGGPAGARRAIARRVVRLALFLQPRALDTDISLFAPIPTPPGDVF